MIKPDVIVSWPRNCDYPVWRQFIHSYREYFNNIIIAFTETNQGPDHRSFVREVMFRDYCLFLDPRELTVGEDWRDVAVNQALLHSYNSEWIWFTEQDFFPKKLFLEEWELKTAYDYIGVKDGDRLHPCSLLIKRPALGKTRRFFGVQTNKHDHFGGIQEDLERENLSGFIQSPSLYTHMAGLSHNMSLLERGESPNYKPEELRLYAEDCSNVEVPQNEHINKLFKTWLNK